MFAEYPIPPTQRRKTVERRRQIATHQCSQRIHALPEFRKGFSVAGPRRCEYRPHSVGLVKHLAGKLCLRACLPDLSASRCG